MFLQEGKEIVLKKKKELLIACAHLILQDEKTA